MKDVKDHKAHRKTTGGANRWTEARISGRVIENLHGHHIAPNCEEPLFKFASTGDSSTLEDIYYELKFWRAAP